MIRTYQLLGPALLLVLFLAPTSFAAEQEFTETFPLEAHGRVSLDNINGDVTIEAWGGSEVRVEYTKRARHEDDLDRMEIRIDARSNRIHIETDYVKSERRFFGTNHSGEVEYRIMVPADAGLDEIDLVNGDLEINGVKGEVRGSLVNGDLSAVGLGGDVELETVNGRLEVAFDELEPSADITLESVNGKIRLTLPSGAAADINAETVHGRLSNDLGIEVKRGQYVGASMRGSVGGGGARIDLETVNGSIAIDYR